jgi:hypothetical protein
MKHPRRAFRFLGEDVEGIFRRLQTRECVGLVAVAGQQRPNGLNLWCGIFLFVSGRAPRFAGTRSNLIGATLGHPETGVGLPIGSGVTLVGDATQ